MCRVLDTGIPRIPHGIPHVNRYRKIINSRTFLSQNDTTFRRFDLSDYMVKHGPAVTGTLSNSEGESLKMKELLDMADEQCSELWNNLILAYPCKTIH